MGQLDHLYCPNKDRTADKMQLQCIIIIIIAISTTVNSSILGNHPLLQVIQEVSLTTILQISKVPTNYNTYFGHSRNLRNSSKSRSFQQLTKTGTQTPVQSMLQNIQSESPLISTDDQGQNT